MRYFIISLLALNIFFTSYIAREVFYNNTFTVENEEHYGECQIDDNINDFELKGEVVSLSKERRFLQLQAELMSVRPPNASLEILKMYDYDHKRMYEEYVKPRVEEYNKLYAELYPRKSTSSRPTRPTRPPRPSRNRD